MEEFQVDIYPVKDGTFLTSFLHPLSKRKVRKAFIGRDDAKIYKEEVEKQYKRKQKANYRELTLEELIIIFIQERPGNAYTKVKMHIIDFVNTFGKYKIDELTSDAVSMWLDQVQKEYKLRDISMRGLKCEIDTLFTFLEDKDIISESPLGKIYYKKYVPTLKSRNILNENQIDDLLKTIKLFSPGYLYPIIKLIAETAAKNKEIVELQWSDLDFEKGTIHFKESAGGKERTLKITDELVSLLRDKKKKMGELFWTYYNEPFTTSKLHRLVTEFKQKKLYNCDWTPLDLRHSFAVNFLAKGGHIKDLQYILGHGKLGDTVSLYREASARLITRTVTNPFQ